MIRHVPPIGSFTSTRDRRRLVVAQHDFVLDLVDVRRDLLEVDLLPLGDDVERVADLEVEHLVLRRVVDAILADELRAALRVGLIDADDAGRHRHAEARFLLVLELVEDLHDVLDRRARPLRRCGSRSSDRRRRSAS